MTSVKFLLVLIAFMLASHSPASAQTAPATQPAAVADTLPPGWEEIDQRLVFFTVQLATTETSLDAVNKALKRAGYHQSAKQAEAERQERGNELMDRSAGGPVSWRQFYGKTAERFFYRPDLEITVTKFNDLKSGAVDDLSDTRMPGPASQRPPQFDYIYRANENAQKRAEADVARLGDKIDVLLARRRQLEAEQAASWTKIAFQAVASRKINSKPLYRFDIKVDGADVAAAHRQQAVRISAEFVRIAVQAVGEAKDVVDNDPAATFDALYRVISAANARLNDQLVRLPTMALDMGDTSTSLGRFVALADRLSDMTKNISDSYRGAIDGDRAGDDQQKEAFRAYAQQALFDCAANVSMSATYVTSLAKEWNIAIDVEKPVATTMPSAVASVKASAVTEPEIASGETSEGTPAPPEEVVEPRLDQVVSVTAKKEVGFSVGQVLKGEKLVLQYDKGRWKSWGRSATEDPDARQQERGDTCRLAIASLEKKNGPSVVLAVVPPGTQNQAFEWSADRTYESVILRINDPDGDYANNPDGGVTYRLRIVPPATAQAMTEEEPPGLTGSPAPIELLSSMKGKRGQKENGAIVLKDGERISTAEAYAVPVRFKIVAKTDSTDLRIGYAADQIIFNWRDDRDQLRIDGGPANGRHKNGAGRVPVGEWAEIELTVLPDSLRITVDGAERYKTSADFSAVNEPLVIFPAVGSIVSVKSVTVEDLSEIPERSDASRDLSAPPIVVRYDRGATELATLQNGVKFFTNRGYPIERLPDEVIGLQFTRRAGKDPTGVSIHAPAGATVYLLANSDKGDNAKTTGVPELHKRLADDGWSRLNDAECIVHDKHPYVAVYKKNFEEAAELVFPPAGFSGITLAASRLTVEATP